MTEPPPEDSKDPNDIQSLLTNLGAKVLDEYPLHPCEMEPIEVTDEPGERRIGQQALLSIVTNLP